MTDPEIAQGDARHRRTLILLWLAAACLIVLTWWQVFSLVSASRTRELEGAERDLANLTRVSQEHANRTLRSADQVLRFVQSRYLEVGPRLDLSNLTAKGVIDTEIFNQVGVIDVNGIYILSNLPIKGRLDLSDREHFKVHVPTDTGELFVSKPVLGRASGKWSIQLSRRITRANGDFAGVAVLSIDPGYFTRFYGELNLGRKGVHALYGLDGVARARKVGVEEALDPASSASAPKEPIERKQEFANLALTTPLFERIAAGQMAGTYTLRSSVDGVERHYYFRKIPQYELAVVAGLDTQELLANHRSARNALWLQAGIVTLLIVALALALTRHLRQIRKEIAARQSAKDLLQDRTEQLNAIFALSPDGFVSFDQRRCVKYVSPAFAQMTAMGEVRLEGLDEHDFSVWLSQRCRSAPSFCGVASLRAQVMAGKSDAQDLIEMDGAVKRTLQVGLRCSQASTVSQILYFRDVTHETEVDQMKSEFLSTAAHELRTPMASILGFSEILLNQEFKATEQKEFLSIILEQSKLMANILNELLDLARIEARRGKDFRYTRVCLQELMADVAKALPLPASRSAPELRMPMLALHVMADAQKLRQALVNVLSNAYKYSPKAGPVVVQIEVLTLAGLEHRVCIQVSDQGIGMSAVQLARVCERFYRADSSGKFPGTGLGMSIVKEILDLHRGQLDIVSAPGRGTRVSLTLPMLFPAPASSPQARPELKYPVAREQAARASVPLPTQAQGSAEIEAILHSSDQNPGFP